jgi:hypothetical protein
MEALRKNAAKYGLFLGLVMVVSTTLIYAIDLSLFTASWYGIVNLLIVVCFGVISSVNNKKELGGFMTFKEAFTSFFITIAIGISIMTLFSILLFNFIDPEAKRVISENVIKMTSEMMLKFGAKPSDINNVIKEMEKSDSFGVAGQAKGFAFNIVIYSIIGLITALIVRRERPQSI